LHFRFFALLHFRIVTILLFRIVTFWHCYFFAFSHSYIFKLLQFRFFALLHFRVVAMSHCRIWTFSLFSFQLGMPKYYSLWHFCTICLLFPFLFQIVKYRAQREAHLAQYHTIWFKYNILFKNIVARINRHYKVIFCKKKTTSFSE
jgi:hypothetical protein